MEIINDIISKVILDEEHQNSILAENSKFIDLEKQLRKTENLNGDLLSELIEEISESFFKQKEKDCEKIFKVAIALGMEIQKQIEVKD